MVDREVGAITSTWRLVFEIGLVAGLSLVALMGCGAPTDAVISGGWDPAVAAVDGETSAVVWVSLWEEGTQTVLGMMTRRSGTERLFLESTLLTPNVGRVVAPTVTTAGQEELFLAWHSRIGAGSFSLNGRFIRIEDDRLEPSTPAQQISIEPSLPYSHSVAYDSESRSLLIAFSASVGGGEHRLRIGRIERDESLPEGFRVDFHEFDAGEESQKYPSLAAGGADASRRFLLTWLEGAPTTADAQGAFLSSTGESSRIIPLAAGNVRRVVSAHGADSFLVVLDHHDGSLFSRRVFDSGALGSIESLGSRPLECIPAPPGRWPGVLCPWQDFTPLLLAYANGQYSLVYHSARPEITMAEEAICWTEENIYSQRLDPSGLKVSGPTQVIGGRASEVQLKGDLVANPEGLFLLVYEHGSPRSRSCEYAYRGVPFIWYNEFEDP